MNGKTFQGKLYLGGGGQVIYEDAATGDVIYSSSAIVSEWPLYVGVSIRNEGTVLTDINYIQYDWFAPPPSPPPPSPPPPSPPSLPPSPTPPPPSPLTDPVLFGSATGDFDVRPGYVGKIGGGNSW